MTPNLQRRRGRARKAFAFVCLLWFAAVLVLLFAFGCSGFSPGPLACQLDGTYRMLLVGQHRGCSDWQIDRTFHGQIAPLCNVDPALKGYSGELDCDAEGGVVQSCTGELHNDTCSYLLAVDRCEKGLCDE